MTPPDQAGEAIEHRDDLVRRRQVEVVLGAGRQAAQPAQNRLRLGESGRALPGLGANVEDRSPRPPGRGGARCPTGPGRRCPGGSRRRRRPCGAPPRRPRRRRPRRCAPRAHRPPAAEERLRDVGAEDRDARARALLDRGEGPARGEILGDDVLVVRSDRFEQQAVGLGAAAARHHRLTVDDAGRRSASPPRRGRAVPAGRAARRTPDRAGGAAPPPRSPACRDRRAGGRRRCCRCRTRGRAARPGRARRPAPRSPA